jgi:hypothetical protein
MVHSQRHTSTALISMVLISMALISMALISMALSGMVLLSMELIRAPFGLRWTALRKHMRTRSAWDTLRVLDLRSHCPMKPMGHSIDAAACPPTTNSKRNTRLSNATLPHSYRAAAQRLD